MKKKDRVYLLAKNGGKLYREHLEPSAFKGTPSLVDMVGSKLTDPIFHDATYELVGALGYKRGSNPALGSVAYTGIHTFLKLLFCWVFIIGGVGEWLLKGLWDVLKVVMPVIGKGLLKIGAVLVPFIFKCFIGMFKIVAIGSFKLILGAIHLIF